MCGWPMKREEKSTAEKPQKPELVTVKRLVSMGWTAGAIKQFLGDPDARRPNPVYMSAACVHLYNLERAKQAESSVDYKAYQARNAKRRAGVPQAVATKKAQLLEYVLALEVNVPVQENVTANAIRSYNRRNLKNYHGGENASDQSSASFLERIAVNYICDELTCYERELRRLRGNVGIKEAVDVLRDRIFEAIAKAYPALESECARQKLQRAALSRIR